MSTFFYTHSSWTYPIRYESQKELHSLNLSDSHITQLMIQDITEYWSSTRNAFGKMMGQILETVNRPQKKKISACIPLKTSWNSKVTSESKTSKMGNAVWNEVECQLYILKLLKWWHHYRWQRCASQLTRPLLLYVSTWTPLPSRRLSWPFLGGVRCPSVHSFS